MAGWRVWLCEVFPDAVSIALRMLFVDDFS